MSGRQLHRLGALRVAKRVAPGHYADGGGLYTQIADDALWSLIAALEFYGRLYEAIFVPLTFHIRMVLGPVDWSFVIANRVRDSGGTPETLGRPKS
jgi:hypothetical protein